MSGVSANRALGIHMGLPVPFGMAGRPFDFEQHVADLYWRRFAQIDGAYIQV